LYKKPGMTVTGLCCVSFPPVVPNRQQDGAGLAEYGM
jgi:hypothetical protein